MATPLPDFPDETLAATPAPELIRLLIRNEDRVPRNVIDECVRRGDGMLDELGGLLEKDYYWAEDRSLGEFWLLVHAVMILGLMTSARAGELLLAFMRHIDESADEELESWFSDHWPALFKNKPATIANDARDLEATWLDEAEKKPDWSTRTIPWRFYDPEEIQSRQRRWAKVDAQRLRYIQEDSEDPYVRETPKVGRNDPCPCGSGKKYKKCCMPT